MGLASGPQAAGRQQTPGPLNQCSVFLWGGVAVGRELLGPRPFLLALNLLLLVVASSAEDSLSQPLHSVVHKRMCAHTYTLTTHNTLTHTVQLGQV